MENADLFNWKQTQKIDEMEAERQALQQRINKLPTQAHRRVALISRLNQLTQEVLKLEYEVQR